MPQVTNKSRALNILTRMRLNALEDQASVEVARDEDLAEFVRLITLAYGEMAKLKGVKVKA